MVMPSIASKKSGLNYGYIVLIASFCIMTVMNAALLNFGVFLKSITAEFGWTRAMASGPYTAYMVVHGVLFVVTGKLVDRFGPRVVVTVCGLAFGLGSLLVYWVTALWQLYLLYGIMLSIGVSGGFVPLASTVFRWFTSRRGLITGILVASTGVGTMIGPPVGSLLLASYGWRTGYLVTGIISLALIMACAQFLKRAPEPAEQSLNKGGAEPGSLVEKPSGLSLREAAHVRQFRLLCVIFAIWGAGVHTITVHIIPHITDLGLTQIVAANAMIVLGAANIIGRVGIGAASDRMGTRSTLIVSFVLFALSLFWLRLADEAWMFYVFAIVSGLGQGGILALLTPLVAELFGMRAHGEILGMASLSVTVGGAIGPLVAGQIFDTTGSYHQGFLIFAALLVVGLILSFILTPGTQKARW